MHHSAIQGCRRHAAQCGRRRCLVSASCCLGGRGAAAPLCHSRSANSRPVLPIFAAFKTCILQWPTATALVGWPPPAHPLHHASCRCRCPALAPRPQAQCQQQRQRGRQWRGPQASSHGAAGARRLGRAAALPLLLPALPLWLCFRVWLSRRHLPPAHGAVRVAHLVRQAAAVSGALGRGREGGRAG